MSWLFSGSLWIFLAVLRCCHRSWCGSFSTARSERTRQVSRFLGWLSYPLYCIHHPVFDVMHYIEQKTAWAHRIGVNERIPATALGLILSIVIGAIIDQLRLQQRLTRLLNPTTELTVNRATGLLIAEPSILQATAESEPP